MAESIRSEMEDTGPEVLSRETQGRRAWTAPKVSALRAGLAETGLNAGYDGVEGTS
jgi:hypothetical protein